MPRTKLYKDRKYLEGYRQKIKRKPKGRDGRHRRKGTKRVPTNVYDYLREENNEVIKAVNQMYECEEEIIEGWERRMGYYLNL